MPEVPASITMAVPAKIGLFSSFIEKVDELTSKKATLRGGLAATGK